MNAKPDKSRPDGETYHGGSIGPARTDAGVSPARAPAAWIALALLALVVLSVFAFRPTLGHALLNWDDDRNFLANPHYHGLTGDQVSWAWNTYHVGVWQPLAWMLLGVEHTIAGVDEFGAPNPRVYHAFSICLHALNAAMVFVVALLLLRCAMPQTWHPPSPPLAKGGQGVLGSPGGIVFACFAAAAVFAVHPLRVEAVAWLSCQPYLPAVLFYLIAVALHVWLHGGGTVRSPAVRAAGWLATLACYAAAVAFKAVAISLPLVLLILDVYPLRRIGGRAGWWSRGAILALVEKLPFFAVAACVALWASAAKDYNESRLPFDAVDYGRAIAQSAWGVVWYLSKTLVPVGLIPYVRLPDDLALATPRFAAAAVGVAIVSLMTLVYARRVPAVAAAWWAYVIILLPNLGLVQISQQLVTDRYAYLAIVPVMVLLAGGLARYWSWREGPARRIRIALLSFAVIAVLVRATLPQSMIWRDSIALWQANVNADPAGAIGHCQLGHAFAIDDNVGRAREHLEKAVQLRDDFAFAHCNLGGMLIKQGEFDAAIESLDAALRAPGGLPASELATVHQNLAIAYNGIGNKALAQKHLTQAQKLGLPPERVLRIMDWIMAD